MVAGILVPGVDLISPFWGLMIALLLLGADRFFTQRDLVGLQGLVLAEEGHAPFGLLDEDPVGIGFFGLLRGRGQGEEHGQGED